jgi:hypothetical protein
MRQKVILPLCLCFFLPILYINAQALIDGAFVNGKAPTVIIRKGSLDAICNEKEFSLDFSYKDMAIGKLANESEYINKKIAEANKIDSAAGIQWLNEWNRNKKQIYEPAFEKSLNHILKKKGIIVDRTITNSKYTMVLHTLFMELGWNTYPYKINPEVKPRIDVEVSIIDNKNPEIEVVQLYVPYIETIVCSACEYSQRLKYTYDRAGYTIGQFLIKKAFKK